MKHHHWRTICIELTEGRPARDPAERMREPVALGWKLEHGHVTAAEVTAWCASVDGLVARGAATLDQTTWLRSAPLRAMLREYRRVLDGRRGPSDVRRLGRIPGRGTDFVPPDTQS